MDVHSSSLLSPNAPAPDQLAEECSAHSQVYSDTRSSDPESSPQAVPCPQQTSQDATNVTDESILIQQTVDNLKVMTKMRGEELNGNSGLEHRQLITWQQNGCMVIKMFEENADKLAESMVEYDLVRNLSRFTDASFEVFPQSFGTLVMPPRHLRNSWVERKQGVVCDPFGMLGGTKEGIIMNDPTPNEEEMGLAGSKMKLIDSKGDGHCFSRSLSTSLFGDQRHWKAIVALFVQQCHENPSTNIRNEDGSPSGENFCDYLVARTLEHVPKALELLENDNSDDLIFNLGVQSMLKAEISELWFSSVEADMLARKFDLDL